MFTLPVAIGDSFAEVVGSLFGRRYFSVSGLGEINKKTVEGVAAMFTTTLVSLVVAVFVSTKENKIDSLQEWLIVSFSISITSTLAETYSPRSTDNFTIPGSTCIVLHIYLLLR